MAVSDASARGWGQGWPAQRVKDMVRVEAGGIRVSVHRGIAPVIAHLLDTTVERGYELRPDWCWGYASRAIAGTQRPSNHSWGLAVDLNAPRNPLGSKLVTDMPSWLPRLWAQWGFRWGGSYSGRKDCLTGDTLVVTEHGPRQIRELAGAIHSVLTTADDPRRGPIQSAWAKAPVESYGFAPTMAVTLRRRGVTVTVRTTRNHRWFVQGPRSGRFVVSADLMQTLRQGDHIPALTYPAAEPVELDARAVAQGIIWGDGSVYNRHRKNPRSRVVLCGPKEGLHRWLAPFGGIDRRVPEGLEVSKLPAELKAIPSPNSALPVVAGFFAGWFACDGCMPVNTTPLLSSSSDEAVSWLLATAPRLGLTVTSIRTQPAGGSGFGSTKPNFTVALRNVPAWLLLRPGHVPAPERRWFGWQVVDARDTGLIEEVFCPTVAGRNVVGLATPSVPLLTGQSMHYEYMGTPAEAAKLAADLATPTTEEEGPMAFVVQHPKDGYIVVAPDGGVFAYPDTLFHGSVPGLKDASGNPVKLTGDIVGAAWTQTGNGYWLVDRTGAVYSFGDAQYLGGFNAESAITRGKRYAVGIRAFADRGYQIVTADPSGDETPFDTYAYRG